MDSETYRKTGKLIRKLRKDNKSIFYIAEKLDITRDTINDVEAGNIKGEYLSMEDHLCAGMSPQEALDAFKHQMSKVGR